MTRRAILMVVTLAAASPGFAASRAREAKASLEFALASRQALAAVEVALSDPSVAAADRQSVTDMALFVFKPGGDVRVSLHGANGTVPEAGGGHFSVRVFVVAGGRLYTGARGQCSSWDNDVALCSASCDGGDFALRRNGSATLELLIGALPGGRAGAGSGVTVSDCGFDESGDAKLTAKTSRGLAVIGFDGD